MPGVMSLTGIQLPFLLFSLPFLLQHCIFPHSELIPLHNSSWNSDPLFLIAEWHITLWQSQYSCYLLLAVTISCVHELRALHIWYVYLPLAFVSFGKFLGLRCWIQRNTCGKCSQLLPAVCTNELSVEAAINVYGCPFLSLRCQLSILTPWISAKFKEGFEGVNFFPHFLLLGFASSPVTLHPAPSLKGIQI